mmetsp:Transcript_31455/g.62795  ORF Transcript_31455/g.62795 Transcript_31455/m.62795 type:complete len:225 (-) Transcript_31455:462-1136(-)
MLRLPSPLRCFPPTKSVALTAPWWFPTKWKLAKRSCSCCRAWETGGARWSRARTTKAPSRASPAPWTWSFCTTLPRKRPSQRPFPSCAARETLRGGQCAPRRVLKANPSWPWSSTRLSPAAAAGPLKEKKKAVVGEPRGRIWCGTLLSPRLLQRPRRWRACCLCPCGGACWWRTTCPWCGACWCARSKPRSGVGATWRRRPTARKPSPPSHKQRLKQRRRTRRR